MTRQPAQAERAEPQEQEQEREQEPLTLDQLRAKHPGLDIWPARFGRDLYARPKPQAVADWPLTAETPAELDQKIEAAAELMKHAPRDEGTPSEGP